MKQRIAVLLPDLRPGGAELMRLQMARRWLQQGFDVEFVLRESRGELLALLPAGASVVDLQASRVRSSFWPLVRYLKQRRPDALLAAMWPLTVLAPSAARVAGFKGGLVVSEHNNMTAAYAQRGRFHRSLMGASMRAAYPFADAVVGVSRGVINDLSRLSGRPSGTFKLVYNPACVGQDASLEARPRELVGRGPVVLSVGTLKRQKRHDLLLQAFARLPEALGVTLCLLGEGVLRADLEDQADALGIRERIIFAGFHSNTAAWYAHADLFVLSSDYEGFGNVVVEALEQGLPVVSTDCPSGPGEILADGKYGRLVPVGDVDALARAMEKALQSPHDRQALKRRAQDFSVAKAADAYLNLLQPGWRETASLAGTVG